MLSILALASLIGYALAQQAIFLLPEPGTSIAPGATVEVELHQADTTSSLAELGIAIGLMVCPSDGCAYWDPANDGIGQILYNGPFNPQWNPDGYTQSFNLTFPNVTGPSILSLTQMQGLGVSETF
ncbi:hypothetical protein OBBRIDRAFT_722450 [Obba rivulosa]|uniref:Uncharacterized protein n=1 Tax=Obba rivulosa TaxID=1052685 RepID=A0A8E2DRZ2_9APHY|nr:hypothetical protein OBBRIDRAFT_722450 [Obba rivulosa]